MDQGPGYSSYKGLQSQPSELVWLQETNQALSFDIKGVLDNKMRVENENFMLKKEIQRVKDQNALLKAASLQP